MGEYLSELVAELKCLNHPNFEFAVEIVEILEEVDSLKMWAEEPTCLGAAQTCLFPVYVLVSVVFQIGKWPLKKADLREADVFEYDVVDHAAIDHLH